jgi:hypothetical protein
MRWRRADTRKGGDVVWDRKDRKAHIFKRKFTLECHWKTLCLLNFVQGVIVMLNARGNKFTKSDDYISRSSTNTWWRGKLQTNPKSTLRSKRVRNDFKGASPIQSSGSVTMHKESWFLAALGPTMGNEYEDRIAVSWKRTDVSRPTQQWRRCWAPIQGPKRLWRADMGQLCRTRGRF